MALAIALVLIVVVSALFHFLSPWWFTPLASNWGLLDDTILVSIVITGVVFVAVNLFIAYAVVRFRHREGQRAAYEPENKKLEGWLTGLTSVGIVVMLAPGLYVYSDMIEAPDDAAVFEALGQQWQWRYRLPGEDGKLGLVDVRFMSGDNPYGIDPDDPNGNDDVLIDDPEMHLPMGRPVTALLRSRDVLHNFYIPQFRAKMDLVPGLVSRFWFTPTKAGQFEILCAELCGVGHYSMRGHVVVEDEASYRAWLATKPTFAKLRAARAEGGGDLLSGQGEALARSRGCVACHSTDGSPSVGPTWRGLFGKTEALADGSEVQVDEAYLTKSIREPGAALVRGYPSVMPTIALSEPEVAALTDYIKSLAPAAQPAGQARQ